MKHENNLSCRPLQLQHNLDKVNESDGTVLHRLGSAASEENFLHTGRSWVEARAKLNALLDEVLLAIRQHLADHLPCDLDVPILYEMVADIHVVFFDSYLEGQLVEFKLVIRLICSESLPALGVSEKQLHVRGCQSHIFRH